MIPKSVLKKSDAGIYHVFFSVFLKFHTFKLQWTRNIINNWSGLTVVMTDCSVRAALLRLFNHLSKLVCWHMVVGHTAQENKVCRHKMSILLWRTKYDYVSICSSLVSCPNKTKFEFTVQVLAYQGDYISYLK